MKITDVTTKPVMRIAQLRSPASMPIASGLASSDDASASARMPSPANASSTRLRRRCSTAFVRLFRGTAHVMWAAFCAACPRLSEP